MEAATSPTERTERVFYGGLMTEGVRRYDDGLVNWYLIEDAGGVTAVDAGFPGRGSHKGHGPEPGIPRAPERARRAAAADRARRSVQGQPGRGGGAGTTGGRGVT